VSARAWSMTWFTRRGIELVPSDLTGYPDWLAEMRQAQLNLLVIHEPRSVPALIAYAESEQFASVAEEAVNAGIDIEWAPHALKDLLPRELFTEHPAWFRMNLLGERTADWNMCATNDEARQVVRENAAGVAAKLRPTTHRYYFYSDDGRPWCQCPGCAGLNAADQSMLFTNTVLEGIRTVDAQAMVAGLAYHNTLEPLGQVAPAEGVFLEYAPIQRSFLYSLDDPGCAVNRTELAKLRRLLPDYEKRMDTAQVLDYWLDESLFWRTAERPERLPRLPFSGQILSRDLRLYAELGFHSVTTYAVMLGRAYRDLHGRPPIQEYGEALLSITGPGGP
jgi:hypothetical protein